MGLWITDIVIRVRHTGFDLHRLGLNVVYILARGPLCPLHSYTVDFFLFGHNTRNHLISMNYSCQNQEPCVLELATIRYGVI